ncbi:hypothetical protein ScPMuIL_005002 [Solemya velum]
MAAPRVWKVLGNQRVGLCLSVHLESRIPVLSPIIHTQVRHKQQSAGRYRDPHVAKAKDKWKRSSKTSEMSKKSTDADHPSWVSRRPLDDIWIRMYYPTPVYSIEQTITMHQEFADPTMLDNMDGLIYADMQLDMSTKKKTKFLNDVKSTILLPHHFDDSSEKTCLVICKTEEDKDKALSLGAKFAGGPEIIKQIQDGDIEKTEFDFVMATPDMVTEIMAIRSLLREKFPAKAKGNLSSNIEGMMELFTKGLTYESTKPEQHLGMLQVPLGRLNMSVDELAENFSALVKSICSHRPVHLGPFIKSMKIIAPPSSETFLLKLNEYVPGYKVKAALESDGEESDKEAAAKS